VTRRTTKAKEARTDKLGLSPFSWLEFDAGGGLVDVGAPAAIEAMLAAPGITDLVVMSHGWKNTKDDATKLYGTLWSHAAATLVHKDPKTIAIVGIVWPAKQFSTDFDDAAAAQSAGGGALALDDAAAPDDLSDAEFEKTLAGVKDLLGPAGDAVVVAARDAAAAITFDTADALFKKARAAVRSPVGDKELQKNAQFFDPVGSPEAVLGSLIRPPQIPAATDLGHISGLGDAIGNLFRGLRAAVGRVLNQLTYYEMKTRARTVGAALGGRVLPASNALTGKRLHLIGHSFGARLVTAAASALPAHPSFDFFSLTLLQGAFSHNGLSSAASGAFANVIGRPSGPISITHTHNDRANTFWYALASRLSNDATHGFGDADDIFGAMGANGAQKLAAGTIVHDTTGQAFAPKRGKVNGFLADGLRRGNSGRDRGPQQRHQPDLRQAGRRGS
jgi:hypothetical protein